MLLLIPVTFFAIYRLTKATDSFSFSITVAQCLGIYLFYLGKVDILKYLGLTSSIVSGILILREVVIEEKTKDKKLSIIILSSIVTAHQIFMILNTSFSSFKFFFFIAIGAYMHLLITQKIPNELGYLTILVSHAVLMLFWWNKVS